MLSQGKTGAGEAESAAHSRACGWQEQPSYILLSYGDMAKHKYERIGKVLLINS